jgi:hypothetical protein
MRVVVQTNGQTWGQTDGLRADMKKLIVYNIDNQLDATVKVY